MSEHFQDMTEPDQDISEQIPDTSERIRDMPEHIQTFLKGIPDTKKNRTNTHTRTTAPSESEFGSGQGATPHAPTLVESLMKMVMKRVALGQVMMMIRKVTVRRETLRRVVETVLVIGVRERIMMLMVMMMMAG